MLKREADLNRRHHLLLAKSLDLLSTVVNSEGDRLVNALADNEHAIVLRAANCKSKASLQDVSLFYNFRPDTRTVLYICYMTKLAG